MESEFQLKSENLDYKRTEYKVSITVSQVNPTAEDKYNERLVQYMVDRCMNLDKVSGLIPGESAPVIIPQYSIVEDYPRLLFYFDLITVEE